MYNLPIQILLRITRVSYGLLDGLPPEIAQRIPARLATQRDGYWAVRCVLPDIVINGCLCQWPRPLSRASAVEVLHAAQASGLSVCDLVREHNHPMRRAVFAYDTTYPHEALPMLPVEFRTHEAAPGLVYEQVIPDTGADASALPWADCAQLALDPSYGVPGLIGGVGTTAAPTISFAIWAHLDGQTYPLSVAIGGTPATGGHWQKSVCIFLYTAWSVGRPCSLGSLEQIYWDIRAAIIYPFAGYDTLGLLGKLAFGIPIQYHAPLRVGVKGNNLEVQGCKRDGKGGKTDVSYGEMAPESGLSGDVQLRLRMSLQL